MKPLLVIGSGGHAKVVVDIARATGRFEVVGLVDRFRQPGHEALGARVLGGEDDVPAILERFQEPAVAIAVGDNSVRSQLAQGVRERVRSVDFPALVHPGATIAADAALGPGTVAMAGAIVNPGCEVGEFCILNTRSTLEHDGRMADYSSLAPGVLTGGRCSVGTGSAIGIGAVLRQGITIGGNSIVGAGAVVLRDIEAGVVAYGIPAVVVRRRHASEPYL